MGEGNSDSQIMLQCYEMKFVSKKAEATGKE